VHAAGRELLEETGYRGRRGVLLGKLRPNPAIQENTLNAVLIEDAVASGPVSFDPAEDIRIALCPLSKIDSLIASGRIAHSLVIAAFYLLKLRRPELWLSGRRTAKASRR